MSELRERIERSWAGEAVDREAVEEVLALLDEGRLRVAEKVDGTWVIHEWVRQAILLWFRVAEMRTGRWGDYTWRDKVPLKTRLVEQGIRVVPPGTVRYGAFLEPGCIVMPGYVNIGAYVGAGSMVDTWATVGSCAQIGRGVHLAGGVGIGGVLEPPGARPVIVEDGCFVVLRCIVVEGMHIEEEAVIGAGTVLTASTPIVDVSGLEEIAYRGHVPARSVVVPGIRTRRFPAGEYQVPCALIIGQRTASTDRKTSLNEVLREYAIPVYFAAATGLAVVLVLVHVATAARQWWLGYERLLPALFLDRGVRFRTAAGGRLDLAVDQGEVWRLFTSPLLHGDALHLLVNALALVVLGRLLEGRVGSSRWLGWFLAGGLAGSTTAQLARVPWSDGASGGAFALMGAAVVVGLRLRSRLDPDERRVMGPVLWAFLALNLVLTLVLPFVDAAGHLGGLAVGLVLGSLAVRPDGSPVAWGRRAAWAAWAVIYAGVCGWGWLWPR